MTLISLESEENAIANIREIIKIMITLKITCFLLIIIETPFYLITHNYRRLIRIEKKDLVKL